MADTPRRNGGSPNECQETRFTFGKNWASFLKGLDDDAIDAAVASLRDMLAVDTLTGKTFLDIGSGSGLFSLAARTLGAHVRSFDYDRDSERCTAALRHRFFPDDSQWTVEHGDVLDRSYVTSLGTFDVVYSWGVLHHTGAMWTAMDHAATAVGPAGTLFVAIYNFQTRWTALYTLLKRVYVKAPAPGKVTMAAGYIGFLVVRGVLVDLLCLRDPSARYRRKSRRGMTIWHNWIDWIGGYPFEAATPEQVFDFYRQRGFELERLTTVGGGSGNNQFVLHRTV